MKSNILKSWEQNAREWNTMIDKGSIPSRKYTNTALLETIQNIAPKSVADMGCGEGWLTREITKRGIMSHGFDATEELILLAQRKGSGTYHLLDFETMVQGQLLPNAPFEMAVFNFSLYQKDTIAPLLTQTLKSLTAQGVLLIQTLHPNFLKENGLEYRSQWIPDSWKGLPGNFTGGHSWYARTMEDWLHLISQINHTTFDITEITDSEKRALSIIIQIQKQNAEL